MLFLIFSREDPKTDGCLEKLCLIQTRNILQTPRVAIQLLETADN